MSTGKLSHLMETKMAKYKCKHCGQVVEIKSDKQWVRSYCEGTGKNVHLVKVSKNTDKGGSDEKD